MAFRNLGFETAGSRAGEAEHWTVSAVTAAERVAVWGTSDPPLDEESFEESWLNDDYKFAFELADTVPGLFDRSYSEGQGLEDFEGGWSNNQGYAFNLGSVEEAVFSAGLSPETVEGFEQGWSGNESYFFSLGPSTAASFSDALSPEPAEGFENGWSGTGLGNDYQFGLGPSTPASFAGSQPFEDFEEVRAEVQVVVDPTTGIFTTSSAHFLSVAERCSFRLIGPGALPTGLNGSYEYFVLPTGLSATTFRVSVGVGGTPVTVVDAGAGVFVVSYDRRLYWVLPYEP